jgi:hypothetical protein
MSEAIRAELRDTGVDISVVMPVVVNTELGSGLPETRGFKAVEPEDVANEIVEALQTNRFEVFVPRSIGALFRVQALVPRRAMEAVARYLKGDQVLANPDHAARAAYEARMARTIEVAERPSEDELVAEAVAEAVADVSPEAPELSQAEKETV